ncbi:hypothetical protein [Hymenobacter daeguensis]
MKKIYLLFLLFHALQVRGQYFSPFRPGVPAQYTTAAGDTASVLQLNKRLQYVPGIGSISGHDSLYSFAPRMKAKRTGATGCDFNRYGGGVFGDAMSIDYPNSHKANYRLYGNYNAGFQDYDVELLLLPYAPLNRVWNATYQHTAQVISRTVQSVLGVPDSVVTIAFSGGQQLRLSKFHGLVDGPALAYFTGVNRPARPFTLTALPRQHLGQPAMGALAMYDFRPGDRLVYQYVYLSIPNPSGPPNSNYLYSDSILSRVNSRTNDTVTYRILRFSQQGNVTNVRTERYTYAGTPLGTRPSQLAVRTTQGFSSWVLLPDAVRSSSYSSSRYLQRTINVSWCNITAFDTLGVAKLNVDHNSGTDYATGLGHVRIFMTDVLNGSNSSTELVGYRKGTEMWGNLPRMAFATLATGASRPATTTAAFPNPFTSDLAVAFVLARPQAVRMVLRDALGRVVLEQTATMQPAGSRQLSLATAKLPAGSYTLHLRFAEEARTEVLKVLKAQ